MQWCNCAIDATKRVSWGLTCDLDPHISKVVHSMQLCMLHMSPLSLFYNLCCKDIVQQHNCTYVLQFGIHNTILLNIMHFLQHMQKHQISPDSWHSRLRSTCAGKKPCVHVQWFIQKHTWLSKCRFVRILTVVINMSSARAQTREEHRSVKSNQE